MKTTVTEYKKQLDGTWFANPTINDEMAITDILARNKISYENSNLHRLSAGRSKFMKTHGFTTSDSYITSKPDPLREHRHYDDEARWVVGGRCTFYIHKDPDAIELERVYKLDICADDMIIIPAHTKHWFVNTGYVSMLRFFVMSGGWTASFTESGIEGEFA